MTSKLKKDKIKQGNRRDFDLLYDVLVSGGTYSDYRSELQDRSMPQEQQNFDISEDDVLAAWILGKDEESEQYARGGHIHQGLNSNLYRQQFGGTWDHPYFNSTTTPGVDTGLQGSANNFSNNLGAYTQIISGVADVIGNSVGAARDVDYGKYDAYLNQIGSYNPGFSTDTSFMMNEWNQMPQFTNVSYEDAGGHSGEQVATNVGKSMLSGAAAGAALGSVVPVIGTAIGAVGGALFGGISQGIGEWRNSVNAKQNQDYINTIGSINAKQNPIKFGYASTQANKLGILNQLSQPYMAACGGKMKNRLASGGYINSHYDYITDPLVKVNAGGTHQENPNEGVQTSIAPDGQPNLVEEGETIINNGQEDAYVFSDRIVADDEILKSHLLPNKFAGKTYADISKELDKIIAEHKNDEISKRTFDEMISRLQQAQEDQKFQEKQEEVEKFLDGLTDEQKEQLEQTMVEEAQAEQQAAEEQAVSEQQAQEQAVQEQQMQPEQAPEQVAMEQPEEQIVPSRYDQMMSRTQFADAADQGMFAKGGHLHQEYPFIKFDPNYGTNYLGAPYIKPVFASDIAEATDVYYNPTNKKSTIGTTIIRTNIPSQGKEVVVEAQPEQVESYSNPHRPNYSIFGQYIPGLTPYEVDGNVLGYTDPFGKFVPIGSESNFGSTISSGSNGLDNSNTTITNSSAKRDEDKDGSVKSSTDYSTWLRYAPAIGSGIQYLSDLFGVTNRNDFSNADMYQKSINNIPSVGFTPLGNYMTYSPLDETYQQNVARSQYNAARRAIQNNASGNASAALAAMDSLNGNINNTFGDLALQAREYNDKQREAVEQFNANIARINSMMSLSAQEKNQAISAEKARLTYNLAQMRQGIEDANDMAKSANFNNLMTNLGNIGRENYIMNQVNNNLAYYYRDNGDGTYSYKFGLTNAEREAAERYAKENGLTIK